MKKRIQESLTQQRNRVLKNEYLVHVVSQTLNKIETQASLDLSKQNEELRVLEIGGAGGITKTLKPSWTISDIRGCEGVDVIASATKMPFENNSFDLIIAIDVLHHLNELDSLFLELSRILTKNGIIAFREPYWSIPAQFIWRHLHPEDFSLKRLRRNAIFRTPLEGNQALAWGLLRAKNIGITLKLKNFKIQEAGIETGLSFALSGGATFTSPVSTKLLIHLHKWEMRHPLWMKLFGISILFYLKKT